jgi:hypothetical protein
MGVSRSFSMAEQSGENVQIHAGSIWMFCDVGDGNEDQFLKSNKFHCNEIGDISDSNSSLRGMISTDPLG